MATWRRLLLGSAIASAIVCLIPCVVIPVVGPPLPSSLYLKVSTLIVTIIGPFQPIYEWLMNRVLFLYSAHGTARAQLLAWTPYALFNTAMWFVVTLAAWRLVAAFRRSGAK